MSRYFVCLVIMPFLSACTSPVLDKTSNYYLDNRGNDRSSGDKQHPWRSIGRLKTLRLHAGDTLFFEGGQTFAGNIMFDSLSSGTGTNPIVITSSSTRKASIDGGDDAAITLNGPGGYQISNITLTGSGRKKGNTRNGLAIINAHDIVCEGMDISGFQKAGLLVYNSAQIKLNNIYAHDNGYAGIAITGVGSKTDCRNISVTNCRAENNPGDPSELNNHSGNGIVAGFCKNVLVDHCVATNNGWDMPRMGNGPVGIWCYEADSVTIQYCTSFQNKTAPGAADGGGFDLDGGVTNSVVQHCLSYENHGSGYGIFQYAGASNWKNNTVRFCISKNDGNVSAAHAGVFIWNSSDDARQLSSLIFCNNIIDNDKGAAISYEKQSENTGFRFSDNIFIVRDSFIIGRQKAAAFSNNQWIKKN